MIKEDMHLHSNFSDDGKNSIEEITKTAVSLGYRRIAFTEHVRRDTDWLDKYVKEIKRIQKKYPNIKIYSGIEAKVINLAGAIDAKKSFFQKLDLVLGAFHRIPQGKEKYLSRKEILSDKKRALKLWHQAMIKLLKNKDVNIIAHPAAILKRYKIKLPDKMKKNIAQKAKKENKFFEMNKKFKVPNKKFVEILKKNKIKFTYGSDSHSIKELKFYSKNN
jgi:HisJ family histidinol phosphate phosphatase